MAGLPKYISGKDVKITVSGLDFAKADSISVNYDIQTVEHKPLGDEPYEVANGVKISGSISGAMVDSGAATVLGFDYSNPFDSAKSLNSTGSISISFKTGGQQITLNNVLIKKLGFSASGDGNVKVDVDFTVNKLPNNS